jgi:hypothetical protein
MVATSSVYAVVKLRWEVSIKDAFTVFSAFHGVASCTRNLDGIPFYG